MSKFKFNQTDQNTDSFEQLTVFKSQMVQKCDSFEQFGSFE